MTTETDGRSKSLLSVRARTPGSPAPRGSKVQAPPTTGKPSVWLSGLFGAPPFTSDVSPRRTAPVSGGELGCGIRPWDELDAGPRFATNAVNQAVRMGMSKSL
jgi:hypothetical protein